MRQSGRSRQLDESLLLAESSQSRDLPKLFGLSVRNPKRILIYLIRVSHYLFWKSGLLDADHKNIIKYLHT